MSNNLVASNIKEFGDSRCCLGDQLRPTPSVLKNKVVLDKAWVKR